MRTAKLHLRRPGVALIWLLAVPWLGLQVAGSVVLAGLDAYDRAAGTAGRAAVRAGRGPLRALGPAGRLLRRLAGPPLHLLRRVLAWVEVRMLLRLFRPTGRWAGWCWARTRPVVDAVTTCGLRQVARLEPLLRRLTAVTEAVERAAGRLAAAWHRASAPVRQALIRLRRAPRT